MANVVLRDLGGNEVEYSGVDQIKAPVRNTAGELVKRKFTTIESLMAYVIEQTDSVGGMARYKILDKLQWLPSENFIMFSISDADYQSYGGDGAVCFVTTKTLTVGETYLASDMY